MSGYATLGEGGTDGAERDFEAAAALARGSGSPAALGPSVPDALRLLGLPEELITAVAAR
ncbi:hypothetical protein [Streptomyces sp. NBC_00158]|uniref:hypothetical protein n=1 Tax=Streptomyces sp. NBC_00158 TaxID=2903627 RepID=UPI00324497D3